jgi:hypothetical protein
VSVVVTNDGTLGYLSEFICFDNWDIPDICWAILKN